MVDKPGHYWDADECGWVRYPAPQPVVEIPAQPTAPSPTVIAADQEGDVRSG